MRPETLRLYHAGLAALAVVEQSTNGGITPRAVQDLREALNLAA